MRTGSLFCPLRFVQGLNKGHVLSKYLSNKWINMEIFSLENTFLCLSFCFLVLIHFDRWKFLPTWSCPLTVMELNVSPLFQATPDTFMDSRNINMSQDSLLTPSLPPSAFFYIFISHFSADDNLIFTSAETSLNSSPFDASWASWGHLIFHILKNVLLLSFLCVLMAPLFSWLPS